MTVTAMEIGPFSSMGVLSFGDTRQIARSKLASVFSTFRKDTGENETDSFDGLGIHLYYDNEGKLEFIEAFPPADVSFRGIRFLGRDIGSVVTDMEAIGFVATNADIGVDFGDAGIALTSPTGMVEGVAAHRKGYYD